MNASGSFVMRAERVGRDTALAQIVALVERAQGSKAPIQRVADRVTGWFVPAVIGIAALTFVGWLLLGPEPKLTYALTSAIAVLIIACPCAMGLATPTAIMVGTGKGAENGILIRDGAALEDAQRITTVVLDKTGTITRGQPVGHAACSRSPASTSASCCASWRPPSAAASIRSPRRSCATRTRQGSNRIEATGLRGDRRARRAGHGRRRDRPRRHGGLPGGGRRRPVGAELDADRSSAPPPRCSWPATARLIGLIGLADTVKPSSAEAIRTPPATPGSTSG